MKNYLFFKPTTYVKGFMSVADKLYCQPYGTLVNFSQFLKDLIDCILVYCSVMNIESPQILF